MAEASVDTTTCLDTCTRGTPARRKARSDHGLKVWWQDGVTETRYLPRRHAHLGTRLWSQRWSGLIWSNPSGVTAAADAICPRSLWKCFSGTALLRWKDSRQFSIDWASSTERRAVRLTESNSMPRKEILCTGESLLFSQLTRSPNRLRWLSTVSLCSHSSARDWASTAALCGQSCMAIARSTGGDLHIPLGRPTVEGGEDGGGTRPVPGRKRCPPRPSHLLMHLREEWNRRRLPAIGLRPQEPIIQPRAFGRRRRPPVQPDALSSLGKHSSQFWIWLEQRHSSWWRQHSRIFISRT